MTARIISLAEYRRGRETVTVDASLLGRVALVRRGHAHLLTLEAARDVADWLVSPVCRQGHGVRIWRQGQRVTLSTTAWGEAEFSVRAAVNLGVELGRAVLRAEAL